MSITLVLLIIVLGLVLASIKQVNQYERGVLFTMGRYSKMLDPGWRIVWPVFQTWQKVDMRTKVVEEPEQEAITQDNVSTKISAVVYYKIVDASKSVLEVENLYWAVSQLAQTTMRNVVGEVSLDELLTKRHQLAEKIKNIVDNSCKEWGVDVTSVELKDIKLPDNMVRTMAKQAEAERERRATIINSEGEVVAAKNLAQAAETMRNKPGALHLRTLNSLNDISSDKSNTVVFAIPLEILRALEGLGARKK
jgi:regulator of protease activity HflC (stomatin/prohibitin superfamily)